MKLDAQALPALARDLAGAGGRGQPEPRLFPADPARRLEVEEAERWGDEILQKVPRRIYPLGRRRTSPRVPRAAWPARPACPRRRWPAALNTPVAKVMARRSDSSDERVQATLGLLPALLDRVEQLHRRRA